ncbi:MAG: hypothetical protein ACD_15C00217G0014 [uncultured bacterium]|nr:MAG: hypothetical protein ACD_15C00217G0014 [uncultured bacterium]
MLESAILETGQVRNFLGQEEAKFLMGNMADDREDKKSFKKAGVEIVGREFDKMQEMMGISAEEIKMFYESITPEDAKDITAKTIERIPQDFMKGDLWTTENLKKFGGKIIFWASMKSPMEAPMIAASIMIITMGEGDIADCSADGINSNESYMVDGIEQEEGIGYRNYPIPSSELHKGILRSNLIN